MHDHDHHGQSLAAWVGVAVISLGALLMTLAVVWGSVAWFVVGAVVSVLGVVAGKALAMAGYGVNGKVTRTPTV